MLSHASPDDVIDVVCRGSPREMGLAQGSALREKIHAARRDLSNLEAFRIPQPGWLPYRIYRRLAEWKAGRFLQSALSNNYPATAQRIVGIADGAGIRRGAIELFNALEPLLSSVGDCTACPGACSAIAVRGRRAAAGEPILARNFDYLPIVQPYYVLRECRPQGKLRSFEFTTAPLAGAVDGLNEAGLCITYNYAYTTDFQSVPAAPISMAISEALERCTSVAEAIDWITFRPRCGGGLLMLCDESGDIATLELSSTQSHVRRPAAGEDVLFHTNSFLNSHMREVQISPDAVYTRAAPTPLRGKRLHQSSDLRDRRFEQLLQATDVLGIAELTRILADHGPTDEPSDSTPCMHSAYWHTTACLQFLPRSRRVRVAYGTACQAQFREVTL